MTTCAICGGTGWYIYGDDGSEPCLNGCRGPELAGSQIDVLPQTVTKMPEGYVAGCRATTVQDDGLLSEDLPIVLPLAYIERNGTEKARKEISRLRDALNGRDAAR